MRQLTWMFTTQHITPEITQFCTKHNLTLRHDPNNYRYLATTTCTNGETKTLLKSITDDLKRTKIPDSSFSHITKIDLSEQDHKTHYIQPPKAPNRFIPFTLTTLDDLNEAKRQYDQKKPTSK